MFLFSLLTLYPFRYQYKNLGGIRFGIEDGKCGFFTLDGKFVPFPNQYQRILTLTSNTSSSLGFFAHHGTTLPTNAYIIFDGYDVNGFLISSNFKYIGYYFNNPIKIGSISAILASSQSDNKRVKLHVWYEGSDDYVEVSSVVCTPSKANFSFDFVNTNKIKGFYLGDDDLNYNIYDICVMGNI